MVPALQLWNLNYNSIITDSSSPQGNQCMEMSTSGFPNAGVYVPVDPTRSYKTHFWAKSNGANGVLYFDLRQFSDQGTTPCASNYGRNPYNPAGVTTPGTWTLYEHIWQGTDFQAGVRFVLPEFLGNYGGTVGNIEIAGFQMFDVTDASNAQTTATTANSTANTANNNATTANTQLATIANSGIITDQERPTLATWLYTCQNNYNQAVVVSTGILSSAYLSTQATAWTTLWNYFYNIIVTLAGSGNYTLPANGSVTGIQVWNNNLSALTTIPSTIMGALAQSPATSTTLGVVTAGSGVVVNVDGVLTVESAYNATYTATLGDGTTTLFTVTHGLDTNAIFYNLWETSGANWVTADATITITGLNTVTVKFNVAPAVGAITILILSSAVITGVGGSQTLPSQTGYGNCFLQTTGTAMEWSQVNQVPSTGQTANAVLASNGTTWAWTNNLTNASGLIATLTAAGYEVPGIVSSLPTLPNTQYPVNCIVTYAGCVYVNNSNVWSNSIATTQLTGTIPTSSLSGTFPTSSLTGTFPTSSLSGTFPTSSLSGTISSAQMGSGVVTGSLLTGLITGSNTAVIATNSILTAIQNLQAQATYLAGQITSINSAITSINSSISTMATEIYNIVNGTGGGGGGGGGGD
jgi:hypothetical protein